MARDGGETSDAIPSALAPHAPASPVPQRKVAHRCEGERFQYSRNIAKSL